MFVLPAENADTKWSPWEDPGEKGLLEVRQYVIKEN